MANTTTTTTTPVQFELEDPSHPCDSADMYALCYEDEHGSRVVAISNNKNELKEKLKETFVRELTTVLKTTPLAEQLGEHCEIFTSEQIVWRDPDANDEEDSDEESGEDWDGESDGEDASEIQKKTKNVCVETNDSDSDSDDEDYECEDSDDDDSDMENDPYRGYDFGLYIQPLTTQKVQFQNDFVMHLLEELISRGARNISSDTLGYALISASARVPVLNYTAVNAEDPEDQ